MKVVYKISLLILLLGAQASYAQEFHFSDSTEVFGEEVYKMMALTNDSSAVQTGRLFSAIWDGSQLNSAQKDSIQQISKRMLERNFKIRPYFQNFYTAISYAIDSANISAKNLSDMLAVTGQAIMYYDRGQADSYFKILQNFFRRQALYYASYNQLMVSEGSYSFEFIKPQEYLPPPVEETVEPEQQEDEWVVENDEDAWGDPGTSDDWGNLDNDNEWSSGWGDVADTSTAEEAAPNEQTVDDYLIEEPVQPEVTGAVLRFKDINLTFTTTFDSANLHKTNGALMLQNGLFVGEGGKFDWAGAGYNEDSVFCTLGKYNFEIKTPRLSAENTKMTFIGMLPESVEGIFQFASQKHSGFYDAQYPRFKSYKSNIRVNVLSNKNTGDNKIIYEGGFALEGRNFSSSSVFDGTATLLVQDQAFKKFKATSRIFTFNDSLINANPAAVTIYHKRDSIYHPSANLRYYADSSELVIRLNDGNFKNTPFSSSYFNVDITADIIRWNINTDSLNIATLTSRQQVPVIFESHEYFNQDRFEKLSQMYNFHPLILAIGYANRKKTKSFYVEDLAQDTKQNSKIIKSAMVDLYGRGLIDFDEKTSKITLNKKGYNYVMANASRKDFDNILMPSIEANLPNATLDLENQELKVRGISKFYISETLNVYITPYDKELTLLNNRNFRFNGNLYSGNFEFVGRNFKFDYDQFLVDLPEIDSIRFYLTDENGKRKRVDNSLVSGANSQSPGDSTATAAVEQSMQQTSGTLFINEPDNKSARKFFPSYPKFDAQTGAVIYFDGNEVLDGAYDKSVYFVVPPFAVDSLSDTDPASIGFEGTLYSGIFPSFDETLRVMGDNSMGFEHKIPPQGYELYKGSGKFYNGLTLDNKGLRGNGTIEFLTSTLESQDFVFFMDSVTTEGTYVEIREGTLGSASFPQAYVENYSLKWLPQADSMYISNKEKPFDLYSQTASLDGSTILTKQGLLGQGTLFTRGSQAISEDMSFEQTKFNANHADFEIQSDDPKKPALAGKDVRLDFDLEKEMATISPEVEGVAAIDFPYAQFKTSITNAVWNLMDETVKMSKPENVPIEKSYFYATRKDLDSLVFSAEEAVYNIPLQQLDVSGVPFIQVADAKIIPENNEVQIQQNAKLHTFKNATLVLDTLNEYHHLINGTIDIVNRNKFTGTATYQFVNSESDTFAIAMSGFRTVTEGEPVANNKKGTSLTRKYTVAEGEVAQEQNLDISPGMLYRGKIKMAAYKPALTLDGYVKLDFKTIPDYNTWIKYESDAEQQQVVFDFENATTERGEKLYAGLQQDNRTKELYATFVTTPHSIGDFEVFKPKGQLSYNQEEDQYEIKTPEKAEGKSYKGEVFTYNENTKKIGFEGPIQFIENRDPGMQIKASGLGTGDLDSGKFSIDAFVVLDMDIPDQAAEMMGQDLNTTSDRVGAPSATQDRTSLLYKAAEFMGNNAVNEYSQRSVANYTSLVEVAPQMAHTLVISDVDMEWSPEQKAWYSTSPIGISNILNVDVNAKVNGFMEIKPSEAGDVINLFMQASPGSWYFFSYQNARLMVWAYNEEFNDLIIAKSKIAKAASDQFAYYEGDVAETMTFINRFRSTYLGITEPFRFDDSPQLVADEEKKDDKKKEEKAKDGF